MPAPRLHRLPQRLDYTLIPAPLDLTLPITDEKSPLPAIIVTPSSPVCPTDFSIAFLVPPPKPSRFSRLASHCPEFPQVKARTFLLILFPLFILACHVLTHRLATLRSHMVFDMDTSLPHHVDALLDIPHTEPTSQFAWLDLSHLWSPVADIKVSRDFVIDESVH